MAGHKCGVSVGAPDAAKDFPICRGGGRTQSHCEYRKPECVMHVPFNTRGVPDALVQSVYRSRLPAGRHEKPAASGRKRRAKVIAAKDAPRVLGSKAYLRVSSQASGACCPAAAPNRKPAARLTKRRA